MKPNGLNPDKAEDDFSFSYWRLAWWDSRSLAWYLLETEKRFVREEAEADLKDAQREYPEVPHRLVKVVEHVSYEEG